MTGPAVYAALVVVLVGILTTAIGLVLPDAVAGRVSRNSEGITLALALVGWIAGVRPHVIGRPSERFLVPAAALGCLVVALALLASDLPSRFRTLNETFLALAVLIPYLHLRRPLPGAVPVGLTSLVLIVTASTAATPVGTDLAETYAFVALTPVALDLVDRRILDPRASSSPRLLVSWCAALVAVPLLLTLLWYGAGVSGPIGDVVRYGLRCTEAFVGVLLVHGYFALVRATSPPASEPVALRPSALT